MCLFGFSSPRPNLKNSITPSKYSLHSSSSPSSFIFYFF